MPSFRLLRLPFLVLKKAILYMEIQERIQLATCSELCDIAMRRMKMCVYEVRLYIDTDEPYISILKYKGDDEEKMLKIWFHGIESVKEQYVEEPLDVSILFKGFQKVDNDNEIHFHLTDSNLDTSNMFTWISELFPKGRLRWNLNLEVNGSDILDRLYRVPLFKKCALIDIDKGKLSCEQVCQLMDWLKEKVTYVFIKSEFPPTFKHEKALHFHRMHYEEARWVRIDELFEVYGKYRMDLGNTNFDNEDLNRYLHHWTNCEKDLLMVLIVKLKSGVAMDTEHIFKNIVKLRKNAHSFFILSKANRKRPVGTVSFYKDCVISIDTWEVADFPEPFETLTVMHQKKDLEDELGSVSKRIEEMLGKMAENSGQEVLEGLREVRQLEKTRKELQDKIEHILRHL